jgi:4'-phosphopantetheinyl transferase
VKFPEDASRLPVDRVDVWIVSLVETPDAADPVRWLSADERARGERFAFERDRRRFQIGRRALRSILANYLGCDPATVTFAYGESGKPRLDGAHAAAGLQFNASGSADLAVCAVTCGASLGVDIEQVRDSFDPVLVQYALSDVERAEFDRVPPDLQTAAFYRTWTRKEAYLKATGCGLSQPLASFAVSVGNPPRLVRDDGAPAALANWSFADFDPAPGWVGTLVYSGRPRPVRVFETEPSHFSEPRP